MWHTQPPVTAAPLVPDGDGTGPASSRTSAATSLRLGRPRRCRPAERTNTNTTTIQSNDMTTEREEMVRVRDRLDAELAELGATIEEMQDEIDAVESDLDAGILGRDEATEAFLPEDRLPASVSNETRGAISGYLDSLSEQRDVRSEEAAMKRETMGVETKSAADARDDVDEIAAVIDRLGDRTGESESDLEDAREQLEVARGRFAEDLAVLAGRLETFDIDLTAETLEAVIDARIPERKSEVQELIESARARIAELSTRKARLAAERDKLASIAGGGTCPTCNQEVGPERTGNETEAIEEELHQLDRQLGAAEQERDELIARRGELADLRDQAIALSSFQSETVASAAGRVEDRKETTMGLRADLEEERVGLTASKDERDRADAAIDRLETEVAALEDEIDSLGAEATEGDLILEAFQAVDALHAQLEGLQDEFADLQAGNQEKETERASLQAEIEALSDEG